MVERISLTFPNPRHSSIIKKYRIKAIKKLGDWEGDTRVSMKSWLFLLHCCRCTGKAALLFLLPLLTTQVGSLEHDPISGGSVASEEPLQSSEEEAGARFLASNSQQVRVSPAARAPLHWRLEASCVSGAQRCPRKVHAGREGTVPRDPLWPWRRKPSFWVLRANYARGQGPTNTLPCENCLTGKISLVIELFTSWHKSISFTTSWGKVRVELSTISHSPPFSNCENNTFDFNKFLLL